ncbi:ubiquitin ligase of SCF [Scheffersomyces coipomensis]|uniref:ubiquitin ligase of SCF n=1 Tax=Scheffersomyces coipomensis TaxID=1788519 RepID=UPI00315D4E06
MPHPQRTVNETWDFVKPGLDCILGANNDVGITAIMYMSCYTAIYNHCTDKIQGNSYMGGKAGARNLGTDVNNNSYILPGAELYNKLNQYLVKFLEELPRDSYHSLLEFYVRKWTRYTIGARYLNNVFEYMNKNWVNKERSDGRREVYDVNTLCLIKWKEEMFKPNEEALINELMDLIEKQRNNEIVDTSLISAAVKSLVFLGIDPQDLKKTNLMVYVRSFEQKFLEQTKIYYQNESNQFLAKNNVIDYMIKCETRLSEEISRSNNYLEDHTKKHLSDALHKVLIEDHSQEIYNEFIQLIERNETVHIQRMYKLLVKVPRGLEPLADSLENYIKDQADQRLKQLKADSESGADELIKRGGANTVDTKVYVHTLIDIYNKYREVVSNAFNNDVKFIKALDNACRHYVNKNVIASPNPKVACKSPEILARYADIFLKKSSKDLDILDMNADNLMIVFKYLNDKDLFESFYRRQLAIRLITDTSKSEELEASLLQRLKDENSSEYTAKMSKMFSDMKASEDLRVGLRDAGAVKDFNPLILAQSMWPFNHNPDYDLTVAPILQDQFNQVVEKYGTKHNGRQLTWLWNHGRAELRANVTKKNSKYPYFTFFVTNTQLMILMAFNEKNSYTFKELHEIVGTPSKIFEAQLQPFISYKLFEQVPEGEENLNKEDTKFTIVEDYKSKRQKVSFISAVKITGTKQEEDDTAKEVDEARRNFLSACIVRIMKSRKTIQHSDLINEVLPQTANRFQAKVIDVKKVIDHLIEKLYIERIENNSYRYLS